MGQSTRTFLTVAAGVVVGGVLLLGLGALTGVVGGGSPEAETPEEAIERSIEEDETSLVGERWCDSETGDRLAQLGADVLATEDPARVVELQDKLFELSNGAPPGAFCAVEELDELIAYWKVHATDSKARKFKPREQIERVREFQREHKLDEQL